MSCLADDVARCLDPVALAESVGMVPDPWQADVLRSDHPRILLNTSRQSGKSTTVAVKAIHVAVFEPGSLILVLSPSQRQSGETFGKVSSVYRSLGKPVVAEAESATTLTLENGSRIVSLPGGSEATVRSFSKVRLLLVDEASRVADDVIAATRPMLAVSGGQLIALSTPFGARGWWHDAWVNGGPTWERVKVTAEDCPRISAEFLEEERRSIGEFWYRQEYFCDFLSAETAAFDAAWLEGLINEEMEPWNL